MQWKAFKNELPEEGLTILYGNYRYVQSITYFEHLDIANKEVAFKPVTHWAYIELPPSIEKE